MEREQNPRLSDEEVITLEGILDKISGSKAELPPALFRFATDIVATSNVDLLVQDDEKRVLLAWREDAFGTGWHVPGSIIRHREEIAPESKNLLRKSSDVIWKSPSDGLRCQIFDDRGHSVSFCYTATLRQMPIKALVNAGNAPQAGACAGLRRSRPALPKPLHISRRGQGFASGPTWTLR